MLQHLLRLSYPTPADHLDPEDHFSTALGTIFSDDLANQHGDRDALITYLPSTYPAYPAVELRLADPAGEDERRKFAHYLWNAGVLMAELWWLGREEEHKWRVKGHAVLELGAGVGLAGIMSVLAGAEEVVISDYPAPEILQNLRSNVERNVPSQLRPKVRVEGHTWGDVTSPFPAANAGKFSRILAADCLWMPHEHANLARSMRHFLSPDEDARVLVIAGFHTGRARMAAFFDVVGDEGLEVEEMFEMDAEGKRREWRSERDGGAEDHGERKKWLVLARLKRKTSINSGSA
ncbi:putative methyltransferase-domain-containing protein [Phyllosticta capitalensis]|uniref:putative methyltransferase-domain-containing protein n=1 Tax=Phyllosticta capitalensis TaxID=121624 RepID=UPI00312E694F